MNAGWVAPYVRSRALLRRCAGGDLARRVGESGSFEEATAQLAATAYAPLLAECGSFAEVSQRLLSGVLWQWRVLAGWCPPLASARVRVLAGPFELWNVDGVLARLGGATPESPLELGSLASVRLGPDVNSLDELRARLAHSPWGDPGTSEPAAIRLVLRFVLAGRVADAVPEAASWASASAAFAMARCLAEGVSPPARASVSRLLGGRAATAASLEELRATLPKELAKHLAHVEGAKDLFRAESHWRNRVTDEAAERVRRGGADPTTLVAALVALYGDALRVRAALALAAHGGHETELLDASL